VLVPDGKHRAIPSVVAFQDGEWQVGRRAGNGAPKYYKTTIYDTPGMDGRSYDTPAIQEAMKSWPFPVVRRPEGELLIEVQEGWLLRRYRPYELSAKIMAKLRTMAEAAIGIPVTPAYWNDSQREDTKTAAKLVGLTVLRLVNTPIAAAIAYGFETPPRKRQTFLVFDFRRDALRSRVSVSVLRPCPGTLTWVDGFSTFA
jgi:molecular chaperone DnaK (HSP70)